MRVILSSERAAVDRLVARDHARDDSVERRAARIVGDLRQRGDAALRRWTQRLDHFDGPFEIGPRALRQGWAATPNDVRRAIKLASRHIRRVAERQLPKPFAVEIRKGVRIEQRVMPLASVGCYVPGGRYPLPSTLLMTAVPARVAGVKEIIVVCPRPTAPVLCAAIEAGATRVLRIGGAQAIAALAYGTESIPRVDKIVGPGNAWVAAAKALVSADCAIDFHAGPSEIVIFSERGRPEWIAADLIAQAEHDPAARAIFVTTQSRLATRVAEAVKTSLPAEGPARAALARNGAIIVARTRAAAIELVNRLAPEHLVCDHAGDLALFRSAGTIFVGSWTAQAAGDYCTGSNHVLPTGGSARFRGGLSAADFVRVFTVQTLTPRGLRAIAPSVIALAEAEGLTAHADSIRVRIGAFATAAFEAQLRRTASVLRGSPSRSGERSERSRRLEPRNPS
jgi:histidinol dehydrogenase